MGVVLDLDMEKCVACGACVAACRDQNDTEPEYSYRSVCALEEKQKDGVKYAYVSMACMHCDDAPCIKGCPSGCLKKDVETGLTVFDHTNCIGCHSCAMACPFGAPQFNEENKMVKCDGCVDRIKQGMKPACVKVCPFFALNLFTDREYQEAKLSKSLQKVLKHS